jgi:hypothetical protein
MELCILFAQVIIQLFAHNHNGDKKFTDNYTAVYMCLKGTHFFIKIEYCVFLQEIWQE